MDALEVQRRLADQIFYLEWFDDDGLDHHGTGFFISPTIALTAFHNLPDAVVKGDPEVTPIIAQHNGREIELWWKLPTENVWQEKRELAVLESRSEISGLRLEPCKFLPLDLDQNRRRREWRGRTVFFVGFPRDRDFTQDAVEFVTDGQIPVRDCFKTTNGERRIYVPDAIYANPVAARPLAGLRGMSGGPMYDPVAGGIVGVTFGLDPVFTATELAHLCQNWDGAATLVQPWMKNGASRRYWIGGIAAGALAGGGWYSRGWWQTGRPGLAVAVIRISTGEREPLTPATKFREGEQVRFAITVPNTGHLYIVDQELSKSSEPGEPYLIFPTLRTGAGRNRVNAGSELLFPDLSDDPPFLETGALNRNADYAGELLTFLLYETPLPVALSENPIPMPPELFSSLRLIPRIFKQPNERSPLVKSEVRVTVQRSQQ